MNQNEEPVTVNVGTESPITLSVKAAMTSDSPTLTVRADSAGEAQELVASILHVGLHNDAVDLSNALQEAFRTGKVVVDPPPSGDQAVSNARRNVGTNRGQGGTSRARQGTSSAPVEGERREDGAIVEQGKYGKYVINHPQAPFVPEAGGVAVLKKWRSQSGNPVKAWIDPRMHDIPHNYQAGARKEDNPAKPFFEYENEDDIV